LGPFLGKLLRETRDAIYEYLLDHKGSPLARTTDEVIQPSFMRWSFRRERFVRREINPVPPHIIDTNILAVNKAICNEALETMYRVNTISLSLQQCQHIFGTSDIIWQGVFSTNTATAKHVLLRMGRSEVKRTLRGHNTIDLDSFFTNIQAVLPQLRSVTVRTDHALHATSALFDIGEDLMNCDQVQSVRFDAVGSLVAETKLGFTMRVEHRRITREWQQQMAKSLLDSDARKRTKAAQCCWTKRSLEAIELGEFLDDHDRPYVPGYQQRLVNEAWGLFSKDVPDAFKACTFESNEFWTYAVGRYVAFATLPSASGSEVDDSSEADDDSGEADDSDVDDGSDADDDSDKDSNVDDSDSSDVATALVQVRRRTMGCGRPGGKAPRRKIPSIMNRYN
jgi:hypothetical protein